MRREVAPEVFSESMAIARELTWNVLGWKGSIHTTNLISGLLFLALGYLIFSGTLYSLSRYAVGTGFQKWLFGLEGWLLYFIR